MDDAEIVQEFLIESRENLARLDQEMVALEQDAQNRDLLASVFRTIHTIKGTCGFLGFSRLEALSHVTEDILGDLRNERRKLDTALTSLILESVDAIKRILTSIEASAGEGEPFEKDLIARLRESRLPSEAAQPSPEPTANPKAPAPQAPVPQTAAPARDPGASATTLRVDVLLLDRLVNLAGELVLTRNQLSQYNGALDDSALNAIAQRLNLITSELQEGVMKTRMQPIGRVWNKFPRIVRDLAASLHKQIDLDMDGAETELDRTLLEAIKDPLTHIVRNSCDHGIEAPAERQAAGKPARGRLSLRAFHESGQVNIEITDDGAGIDPEKVKAKAIKQGLLSPDQAPRLSGRDALNLVFLPGFSTAATITNVSGRGVGMDVVRTHIERIGGAVDLVSRPGHGTTVRIKIPLTLAIIPGLAVTAGGQRFVIPQTNLQELIRLEGDAVRNRIESICSTPVFRRRDALLPLVDLCRIFHLAPQRAADEISLVVLQADENCFGLIVDAIGDNQEIVVKPLGHWLKGISCYAGATIMGDGQIALILDIAGLASHGGVTEAGKVARATAASTPLSAEPTERSSLLICRAGGFDRLAVPLNLVSRLEKIAAADVERAAGRVVVQYRNRILPLVSLAEWLGGTPETADELQVVVCGSGDSELGLVVDEIADIVEETVASPRGCDRPGLLGSAVVGDKVADFPDLGAALEWASASSAESLRKLQSVLASGRAAAIEEVPR
jgi:two-component system chemotaxis sensor kinase CheA